MHDNHLRYTKELKATYFVFVLVFVVLILFTPLIPIKSSKLIVIDIVRPQRNQCLHIYLLYRYNVVMFINILSGLLCIVAQHLLRSVNIDFP